MKVSEDNLKCRYCQKPLRASREDLEEDVVMTKCYHLFHKLCFLDGLSENVDYEKKNLTKIKHHTVCPAKDGNNESVCDNEITHKLKASGTGDDKVYEVIKLEDVKEADIEVIRHLLESVEEAEPTTEEQKSFKNAAMILGAITVGTIAGLIFHAILAVAIGAAVGYGLCFLVSKAIDFISTTDFKGLATRGYNYFFSDKKPQEVDP